VSAAIRFLTETALAWATAAFGQPAGAGETASRKPEAEISLPAAAADAIREAFPGSTVKQVRTDAQAGLPLFLATVIDARGEREVSVSAAGVIVTVKREIAVADLPAALARAVRKLTAGDTLEEIETRAEVAVAGNGPPLLRTLPTPRVSYGPPAGLDIDPDGRVWKTRRRDADDEVRPGEEGVLEVPRYPLPCVVYLPSDYKAGVNWPLILHLHGSGDSATTWPWLWGTNGKGYIILGLSYAALEGGGGQGIGGDPASVAAMIRFIEAAREVVSRRYGIDQQRVFLSGTSMGGWGVNLYGFHRAARDRYRGYCILAAGPVNRKGVDFAVARDRPVLVLNGAADGNLPVATQGVPLLEKAGARVTAIVIPGAGHMPDPDTLWPHLARWLAEADPQGGVKP